MKFILKFKNWIFLLLILVAGVAASRSLFMHNWYFNMHDDLQMLRQLELEKCFKDGQIPCRWVPDMGYLYGFPLFNYYPQLPYLFGEVFRLFQLPFNDVAKLTFALGIIASGLTMYLLSKEYFGKLGGLLSSVFYMWAPYHAVDVYVRGAMNESWAWVWFPLILWSMYRLIKKNENKYLIMLALSLAALLLTHNLMVLIFIPVALIWFVFWLIESKSFKSLVRIIISGTLGLGLAAFFTLPSFFEQKYVHIDYLTQDYFQYFAHYATLYQLFISRFWGDGPSVFGPNDGLAFPVGQIHWVLILLILVFVGIKIWKKKKIELLDWLIFFGAFVGTLGAFMSHERSTFIWKLIPTLSFVQFPWRFLTLTVLGYSFAIGGLFYALSQINIFQKINIQWIVFGILSIGLMIFNWNYFYPVHSGPLTDEQKFSGESWRILVQAGIRDYLPIEAKVDPNVIRQTLADVIKGKGTFANEVSGTDWAKFNVIFSTDNNVVRVNIYDFPAWKAFIDGKEVPIYIDQTEQWGRMYIQVPKGAHEVYFKLYNTPLRTISNVISGVSWLVLLGYLMLQFKRGRNNSNTSGSHRRNKS